jgi:hypothetical protein
MDATTASLATRLTAGGVQHPSLDVFMFVLLASAENAMAIAAVCGVIKRVAAGLICATPGQ